MMWFGNGLVFNMSWIPIH